MWEEAEPSIKERQKVINAFYIKKAWRNVAIFLLAAACVSLGLLAFGVIAPLTLIGHLGVALILATSLGFGTYGSRPNIEQAYFEDYLERNHLA